MANNFGFTGYQNAWNNIIPPQQQVHPLYGSVGRYDIGITSSTVSPDETVPATLIVDSRKRNTSLYPDAGHYVFELNKQYSDVVSLELVSTSLPNSGYGITQYNNKIYLSVGNVLTPDTTLTIPPGNYTYNNQTDSPEELLNVLNAALTDDDLNTVFTFGFEPRTQRFIINKTDTTEIRFFTGLNFNADDILGLNGSDDFGSGNKGNLFTVDGSTMPRNFMLQPHRYVTMKIRGFERCEGNTPSLDGAFAVIPLDTSQSSFTLIKEGDTVDSDTYVYYFPEPLGRLRKLEITFYDPYGNIYDFNGHNHYMIFQIQSLTRPRKYVGCN